MINEYYKCNACGSVNTIVSNGDAACCTECGTPEDYEVIEELVWTHQKPDRHFWAFVNYCKRKGDDVHIENQYGSENEKILIVTR